ncbi:SDR family NAD(P)-dependent oxidoreductase [Streptomyces sp. NPDC057580]|uniref:SDR family NAD(P)-dependent oxidoreductase n=1 Tax=Streptomyces sp. NPDC057580 TaxID=3346173 RepID=UPI0036AAA864
MTAHKHPEAAGRAVIVTGGARGIGKDIVDRLLDDGYRVGTIDLDPGPATAEKAAGRRVDHQGSVTDEQAIAAFVDQVTAELGPIHGVVNNAGLGGLVADTADYDFGMFERVLGVNVLGPVRVLQKAIPSMLAAGRGGRIVNIGSMFGQSGVAGSSAYCASKAALHTLTHCLALELAPHGITANTVAPGNVLTDMHLDALRIRAEQQGVSPEEQETAVRAGVPLGRHGTGHDIAPLVSWLLSDASAYMTGQTIGVNGGVLLS